MACSDARCETANGFRTVRESIAPFFDTVGNSFFYGKIKRFFTLR